MRLQPQAALSTGTKTGSFRPRRVPKFTGSAILRRCVALIEYLGIESGDLAVDV